MEKLKNILIAHWEELSDQLPHLLDGLLVLVIFILLGALINRIATGRLRKQTENHLRALFIAKVMRWLVIIVGVMLAMRVAGYGEIAAGLLAGAGISALVVGLALKDIGENFLAGFLLSFSRPFRINDIIEVEGIKGRVLNLNLRNTHLKTMDGKDVFIPNASLIKTPLENHTLDGYMRYELVIGVDYGTDFGQAREIIKNVLKDTPGVADEHNESSVNFGDLGSSTYNIQLLYWVDMFHNEHSPSGIRTRLVDRIIDELDKAGVNMPGEILELKPYPQMEAAENA